MKQRGFSLIELMVAVGILTIINIMIFASYPEFSQKMALKRTSEEIALIVRQAQVYAMGIKRPVSIGDDYFGFGVHFETNDPKSLILFADSGPIPDKTYDDEELFQKFTIGTGDYISKLEECDLSDVCEPVTGATNILDVVYPRASSMAEITADSDIGSPSYAQITIKSPRGDADKNKKIIKIWRSGQISVE